MHMFQLNLTYLSLVLKVNQLLHLFSQFSLQFFLQILSFTIILPPLYFFVLVRNFGISVEVVITSLELGISFVVVVVAAADNIGEELLDSVLIISVDVVCGSKVNGKHEVVLKQKFPTISSVKNPKRVISVSTSRESCCSQFTPINSFCGNNEAK